MKDQEVRYVTSDVRIETRADGSPMIAGYAAVFRSDSVDLGGFTEEILPGAFSEVIGDDVRALFNHDSNFVLGRLKSGTLRIVEDDKGLRYEIDPPDNTIGKDTVESIKRGDVDGSSFAFRVKDDDWNTKDGKAHRVIAKFARLYDVGPVTYPAYPDTSVAVRGLEEYQKRTTAAAPSVGVGSRAMKERRQRQASALK